jgi:hypothetical protein
MKSRKKAIVDYKKAIGHPEGDGGAVGYSIGKRSLANLRLERISDYCLQGYNWITAILIPSFVVLLLAPG